MAAGSNAFYSQQYASAVELVAQQTRPRLVAGCTPMTAVGKSATVVNFVDSVEADERTTLYDDIVYGEVVHTRPWVYPRHFDKALPFDSIEQMQMMANPQSEYVQAVVAAINRKMDAEIIRAFFADRNVGENGTTTDSFAAARQISVDTGGTASGLNVEKLQLLLQTAKALEVGIDDGERFNIAISPRQERDLMNEIEVISSDFTTKRIMDAGTVVGSGYMGFNWIVTNLLGVDGSSYRRVPVWTNRGMAFCTWNGGLKTDVDQDKGKRGLPWRVYAEGHFGAVRRDDKRVFEIKCAES